MSSIIMLFHKKFTKNHHNGVFEKVKNCDDTVFKFLEDYYGNRNCIKVKQSGKYNIYLKLSIYYKYSLTCIVKICIIRGGNIEREIVDINKQFNQNQNKIINYNKEIEVNKDDILSVKLKFINNNNLKDSFIIGSNSILQLFKVKTSDDNDDNKSKDNNYICYDKHVEDCFD